MKRPGARLRAIIARLCCPHTMERLVDSTLGDLQAEYENAISSNRKWESRRIVVRGYVALIRVMALHGATRAIGSLSDSAREDRQPLIRILGASAVVMLVGTLLLMVPFFKFVWPRRSDSAELALYLIPQALPVSIPVGLTFGILWGRGKVAGSRRSQTLILLLATLASAASFTVLAWVAPNAIRLSAFR